MDKHNISFCLRSTMLGKNPHAKLSIISGDKEVDVWITPTVKYLEEKHFTED